MEITLEKIELVKDRTGVSYKEAKEALEAVDGSVVDAIIKIEENIDESAKTKLNLSGGQLLDKVKEIVKKGNVSRIIVKRDDEVILNLPVSVGLLGTVLAPWVVVGGTVAALGTKCVIELVKDDGEIVALSEMANGTIEEIKEKSTDVYQTVKTKTADALSKVKKDDEGCSFDDEENCDCTVSGEEEEEEVCECGDDCECKTDDFEDDASSCGCGCGCTPGAPEEEDK